MSTILVVTGVSSILVILASAGLGARQAIYVVVFLLVFVRWQRARTPAHLDMMVFFAILAFAVVEQRIATLLGVVAPEWFTDILIVAIVARSMRESGSKVPIIVMTAAESAECWADESARRDTSRSHSGWMSSSPASRST
ncbi:MAG: hypothetical protein M3R54_09930 [Chloroflexota bacterium]|nr:hypothetical protein [Chloroflexota bacterium]